MAKKIIKRTKDGETLYFGTHTDAVLSEVRVGKESLTATLSAIITSFASYYTKSETYSQAEVDQLVSTIKQFNVVVASSLPTASASTMNTIYLIPSSHSEQGNVKDEFITIQDGGSYKWEQIGTTAIDLSDYSTTAEMNAAIASALSAYSTTSAMNAAIAAAVSNVQDDIDELSVRIRQDETSDSPIQSVIGSHPVTLSDAYSTNNVLWNGTVNVGQTFSEGIIENQNNNVIYKIAVTAGQVVKFNVRPSGYGNYGKVLLTDANRVVKAKVDRGEISDGTTIAVEYDGWLYTNSTNTVNNPLDIQDVVTYLSNKKLTEMAGKADADDVSYDNTVSGLFSGDVQNAVSEIINSEIAFDYTFAKTGRFNLDGTINANSDYRITFPLLLKAGVTLKVTTYINSQYGYIATTDESGSSYTVVVANRSADGEVSGSYTAETDVWVAFSLKINYDASVARLQYPKAITGEKVAYDASATPIITGDNMQQAVEDMYNMVAGAFTVEYSNAGSGFVDMRTHEISDSGYFRYTNPLQLSRGDEIIVTTNLVGYIAIISLTDAQGSYYTPVVSDSGTWETIRTFTYTASSDCYVVISHAYSQTTYQIKYMKRFLSDALESYDSQLKKSGGDFIVLGDSITADVNGWTKDVANTYGLPLTNIAVAGSVWCSYAPYRVDLSGSFTEDHGLNNIENQVYRFLQMITPVGEIVPELTEDMVYNTGYSYPVLGTGLMDRDNVRLIGISCGGNDNNLSYQDGDLDVVCSGDVRDVDRSTMRGIIRWTCVLLQYYCPNAKIFMLTPTPTGRSTSSFALERVGNNIKTVAYRLGVNVVDMQYCGISSAVAGMTIIPDTNNASRYFRDGLHPNNFGQRLMGGYVTSVLDTWWKY